MNKKGIALIFSLIIIVALTTLGATIVSQNISEGRINQRYTESIQAFWLAEAGVNKALSQLKADFNNSNAISPAPLGQGEYSVDDIEEIEGSNRKIVIARGFIPSVAAPHVERRITVLVEGSGGNPSSPDLIDYAIDTTGILKIGGSVNLNPPGSTHYNSGLDFEEVFGMTKEAVKAMAAEAEAEGEGHVYTNPATNQQPVDGITWVELTQDNKYIISSSWTGSGLLIVNGNGANLALKIEGDWIFNGMIWIIGKVKISGNPEITGAIFAESSAGIESDLTGNPTLNFNSGEVGSAFNLLGSTELEVLSWREF